jgi:hypothetical protein
MKAQELRIGNFVLTKYRGEFHQKTVESITKDGIDFFVPDGYGELHTDIDTDEPFPIPLTEDWLLKFGFKKLTPECFEKKYSHQGELLIFSWETPVGMSNNMKEGEYYFFFNRIPHTISHVHTLQNLYFALTGEELTIQ